MPEEGILFQGNLILTDHRNPKLEGLIFRQNVGEESTDNGIQELSKDVM